MNLQIRVMKIEKHFLCWEVIALEQVLQKLQNQLKYKEQTVFFILAVAKIKMQTAFDLFFLPLNLSML